MSRNESGPLKILFVLPANVMGGAEIWAFNLLSAMRNFRPVLLVQANIGDAYAPLGIKVYHFEEYGCHSPYLYSPANLLSYARAIRSVAQHEKPGVIFGLMHNGSVFVATAALSIWSRKTLVLGSILGSVSAYFVSIGQSPNLYERLVLRLSFWRLGGIVTPSKGVRLDLIENFHVPPRRIATIQNGFNLESNVVRAMESVAIPKDCAWVVSACRLSAEKDFDTLLRAFRKVRNECRAKLLIVGDGALRDDIVALGWELGLGDDLLLLGHKCNPFPYMAMADVFVLSSHHEGFGNVIVEAMSVGTPVVATDCPFGPREIIVDGKNGFLVPVKDAGLMAKRCLLLIQDSDLRKSMGHLAKSCSRDFSMELMGRQFEDYLDCLLRRS